SLAHGRTGRLGGPARPGRGIPRDRVRGSLAARGQAFAGARRPDRLPFRRRAEEHRPRRAAGGGAVPAGDRRPAPPAGAALSPAPAGRVRAAGDAAQSPEGAGSGWRRLWRTDHQNDRPIRNTPISPVMTSGTCETAPNSMIPPSTM